LQLDIFYNGTFSIYIIHSLVGPLPYLTFGGCLWQFTSFHDDPKEAVDELLVA
jgi:hypothetical protein